MKVKTFYNYNHTETKLEKGKGELITVPEQSLSVKQILERYRRGNLDYEQLRNNGYYDDPDVDIDKPLQELSDFSDIDEIMLKVQNESKKSVDSDKKKDTTG